MIPASNYHFAETTLLSRVPIDPGRVHRMPAERPDLDAAAAEYSDLLASSLPSGHGGAPRLDVVLLGLGENGHTASLFPDTPALTGHRPLGDTRPRRLRAVRPDHADLPGDQRRRSRRVHGHGRVQACGACRHRPRRGARLARPPDRRDARLVPRRRCRGRVTAGEFRQPADPRLPESAGCRDRPGSPAETLSGSRRACSPLTSDI